MDAAALAQDVAKLRTYFLSRGMLKRAFRAPVRLWGFSRADLARLLAERGYRTGAEIGVQGGVYSEILCRANPELELLAVDPWFTYGARTEDEWVIPDPRAEAYRAKAKQRLAGYRVTFLEQQSLRAVSDLPDRSIDFAYIDGNHTFDYAIRDLIEWSRRVRVGGILAGHDFLEWDQGGVVAAVQAYTRAHGIEEWYLTDDQYPSFFWVNP